MNFIAYVFYKWTAHLMAFLLLHFARAASNLAVFNYFIIWNSTFFYYYFTLLSLQNFSLVQWAPGYFGAQRRWKLKITSHTQTIIKQGLSTDLSVSGYPTSVYFIPKSVLFSPKVQKCSVQCNKRTDQPADTFFVSRWFSKVKFGIAFI